MTYTIDQWIADFGYVKRLASGPAATPSGVTDQARDHFYLKYQADSPRARFARFSKALQFLGRHFQALSLGRAALSGETKALEAKALVLALYEYFTSVSDKRIDESPTVEQIRKLAFKHEALGVLHMLPPEGEEVLVPSDSLRWWQG